MDYANQPVVFIEDYYYAPQGTRLSRFWAAHGGGTAYFPLIMVDSGSQLYDGYSSQLYNIYKSMVDTELARAPQAEVSATQKRVGSRLQFDVTVKNLSGVSLSSANSAAVHVLVYEDIKAGVTSRYMRAAPYEAISTALANNAAETYHLETADLSGVDWGKLHAVAVVDYRPGSSGKYDMLQAAVAVEMNFSIKPESLTFWVDTESPVDQQQPLSISGGSSGLTWTITESIPWLAVTPSTGTVGQSAAVQVDAGLLAPGWQYGSLHVTITGPGVDYQKDIPVSAFLGDVQRQYLPQVMRQ